MFRTQRRSCGLIKALKGAEATTVAGSSATKRRGRMCRAAQVAARPHAMTSGPGRRQTRSVLSLSESETKPSRHVRQSCKISRETAGARHGYHSPSSMLDGARGSWMEQAKTRERGWGVGAHGDAVRRWGHIEGKHC